MSTLAIWCRVVQSRDVSPHNFDGLAMSGLAFSVALYYVDCWCVVFVGDRPADDCKLSLLLQITIR